MLLRLVWMTSPAIGLWCVYALASVFVQPVENNAQPPAAIDPPQPFTVIVRTVPIIAADSSTFDDRWQLPQTAAKPDQPVQASAKLSERVSHRAEHRDSVCGTRGRRYFHVGRRLSWRCRR
jgi:hypothetical protein